MNSSASPVPIGQSEDFWIYVFLVAAVAILGVIANGTSMFILYGGGRIGNAFQQICFSHCVSNSCVLLFFLFYCCPIMTSNSDWSVRSNGAKLIGGIMVGLWDVGVYSHLMTSVNRLIAITWPLQYKQILTPRNTKLIIAGVWLMGFLHFSPYLKFSECYIIFSGKNYLWMFAQTSCGWWLGNPLDFYPGITVSVLIALMDIWSLIHLKKLKLGATGQNIKKRDVMYFCQTILQFVLFVVKKGTFYELSQLFVDDPVGKNMQLFFTTTFCWELFHLLDGAALIPFHVGDYLKRRRDVRALSRTFDSRSGGRPSGKIYSIGNTSQTQS